MIQQGFYINKNVPRPWWFMVYYDVATNADRDKVYGALLANGSGWNKATEAISVLREPNTAHISSDVYNHSTIIALSKVTSYMEFFNSITHELQHATAHVCKAFSISYDGEQAAYIQGEIGEELYKGVALSICPKCNCGKEFTRINI